MHHGGDTCPQYQAMICLKAGQNMNKNYDFESLFKNAGEGNLYKNFLNQVERPLLEWSLTRTWGNQIKAARILGLNRNTIRAKIKKMGINPKAYK